MGYNFPNAPATGATYTPSGGPTYTWDGIAWKSVQQGVPVTVYVSDTPPPSPAPGQLWWNSTTGNMAIWYSDPDSAQWVQVSGSVSAVQTAQTRNRIVNGAMQVSQENGNTAFGSASWANYLADQYQVAISVSPGTMSGQRVQLTTPNGSKDRIRLTVGTAKAVLSAGDYVMISHTIEGIRVADFRYGSASAKQAVLRFGWKSPAGTYSVVIRNATPNRNYIANFTISAGQANADTEQVLIIPGDTTGTWATDTSLGITMLIVPATGSTYHGVIGWQGGGQVFGTAATSNGMATAGAVYELYDVGLYLDPNATGVPPAWVMPDEADELLACMRYWYRLPDKRWQGYSGTTTPWIMTMLHPVRMRTAPALNVQWNGFYPGDNNITGLTPVNNTVDGWCQNLNAPSGVWFCRFDVFAANARM